MKILLTSALLVFPLITSVHAKPKNLLENGSFTSSKFKHWHVGVTKKYGQELDFKVKGKAIHFSEIKGSSPKYITLSQFIKIEKGKKYVLSFEAKTSEKITGKATVNVGRPGFARTRTDVDGYDHLKLQKLELKSGWTTHTYEFTGTYKTDNKNYRGKNFKGAKLKEEWRKKDKDTISPDAPTWLIFNLGGLTGDISLKNISITVIDS